MVWLVLELRGERELSEPALADSRGRIAGPNGAAARMGITEVHARNENPKAGNQEAPVPFRLKYSQSFT